MSSPIQKQFDELIQLISLAKFKEALDLVDEISKTKGISKEDTLDNMLFKSEIEYFLGNYKKSLQQAEKVLKESKELDNTKLIIKSLYRKIAALNILGKLNECLVLNEKAMKLMTEKNLLDDKAMLRTKLRLIGINGVILANTGKYDIGLEKIQQAIDLAEKSNDKQMFAFLTTHLGLYTLFSGDKEKAEKIINRAYKIALDLGNKLEIAIATLRLGVLKTYEQLHEEALELFFNSIEIAEETGSTHLFFATYLNIGETYRDLFQFDEAIKYMKKALTFESGYAFMINTDLAGVYYWKNELDLALEHFLISLEKSNELKDRRYNPLILYQLVNLYVQKKQFKEAEQHLNQLEKIRTEEKLKQYNEFYIVASIQFYKESSNIQDWSKAIDLAEEFLTRKDIPVGWRIDLLYTILERITNQCK